MKYDVFISYRRDGGDNLAQLIYDRLHKKGYRVFLDIESLRSGKFNEKLLEVIEECHDMVLILPPNSLERCSNPGDWVYQEVTHAMKHGKNIVPIMMKGFEWPETMPEGLEGLSNYNGIQDSKDYFDAVIEKLESLLKSKTKKGDLIKEKLARRRKVLADKLFGKKSWLVVLGIVVVLGLAGFGGYKYYTWKQAEIAKEQEAEAKRQAELALKTVTVRLTPGDDMSVKEYNKGIEIVKERMDLFAGEGNYTVEESDQMVELKVPIETFGSQTEPIDMIRAYISRPIDLYLCELGSLQNRILLEREDVLSVEFVTGSSDAIDLEQCGLEPMEEYTYGVIRISSEAVERFEEVASDAWIQCALVPDIEGYSSWWGYHLFPGEEVGEFYFVDSNQMDNVHAVIAYNFTHETFENAFYSNVILPVKWEEVSQSKNPGKLQCNVEELPDNQLTIQYSNADTETTSGEYSDVISLLKSRLDALGLPYAFGQTVTGEYDVSIRTSTERLNSVLIDSLMRGYNFSLSTPFSSKTPYIGSDTEVYYEKQADGTYTFNIQFANDYQLDNLKVLVEEMMNSENHKIQLEFEDYVLSELDVEEHRADVENGLLVFKDFSGAGMETIGEEELFLLEFLTTCSQYYSTPSYNSTVIADDPDTEYTMLFEAVDAETIQEIADGILPNVDVRTNSTNPSTIYMEIAREEEEVTAEQVIDLIKQVYEKLELKYGKYTILLDDDQSNGVYYYISPDSVKGCMKIEPWRTEGDALVAEVNTLLAADPFFKETLIYVPSES